MALLSAKRTRLEVTVEIPPSPYPLLYRKPLAPSTSTSSAPPKEQLPAAVPSNSNSKAPEASSTNNSKKNPSMTKSSTKRTLSTNTPSITAPHALDAKKRKTSGSADHSSAKPVKKLKTGGAEGSMQNIAVGAATGTVVVVVPFVQANANAEVLEGFPQGYFTCHQCSKRCDLDDGLQCTLQLAKTEKRCTARYCGGCLWNRYQVDVASVKDQGLAGKTAQDKVGHVLSAQALFNCPRCKSECNCRICRKAAGLLLLGKSDTSNRPPRPVPVNSEPVASNAVAGPSKALAVLPAPASATTKVEVEPKKPRAKRVTPSRIPRPDPVWSRIPIELDQTQAEDRIQIREFIVRFLPLITLARGHVQELDHIGGALREDGEGVELQEWVSVPCAKAVLGALLGLLADDEDGKEDQIIRDVVKKFRTCGSDLTLVWSLVHGLAEAIGPLVKPKKKKPIKRIEDDDEPLLESLLEEIHWSQTLPPPLPAPSDAVAPIRTRGAIEMPEGTPLVACTAQLVPLMVALVDAAIDNTIIYEELKEGRSTVAQEFRAHEKELLKVENERWISLKEEKAWKGKERAAKLHRDAHESIVRHIRHTRDLASHSCTLRSAPLGKDHDGRVYWALSPNVLELEAAVMALNDEGDKKGAKKAKADRVKAIPKEEEREQHVPWSWLVAVYGKRPDGMKGDEEEEQEEEGWYAFSDPEEIRNVAGWIAITSKCDTTHEDDGSSTTGRSSTTPAPGSAPIKANGKGKTKATSHTFDPENPDAVQQLYAPYHIPPKKRELRTLVKGLEDYALLLEWRLRRKDASSKVDEETVAAEEAATKASSSVVGKMKPAAASKTMVASTSKPAKPVAAGFKKPATKPFAALNKPAATSRKPAATSSVKPLAATTSKSATLSTKKWTAAASSSKPSLKRKEREVEVNSAPAAASPPKAKRYRTEVTVEIVQFVRRKSK